MPLQPTTVPNPIEKYQFMHHFVPHAYHKKRATLLSHNAFLVYIFGVLLLFGVLRLVPKVAPGVLGYASDINISELLSQTNKKRAEQGLKPLTINPQLTNAAYAKADHMFKNNYWAHIAPDGTKPWDFIVAQNYNYSYAGENLAKNFNSSSAVVSAWYESPSHRDNLLSSNYSEVGFAVVNGVLDGYETTLVVQMFGQTAQPSAVADTSVPPAVQAPAPVPAPLAAQVPVTSTLPQVQQEATEIQPQALPTPTTATELAVVSSTPRFDLPQISSSLLLGMTAFLLGLFALDIWYSRKKAIPKFTGHAFAHFTFLFILMLGVWLVLAPGKIL